MNQTQFLSWLEQGPSSDDVEELRSLVARYPFSGPLRMLLAKASDRAEHLERRDDLLAAGAHVPSRKALFAYMMGPALVEMAREVHAEVLALPEVSEEDVVAMVWHDRPHPSEHKEELENLQEAKEDAPSVDASGEEAPGVREAMVAAISSVIEEEVTSWETKEASPASEVDATSPSAAPLVPPITGAAAPTSLFGQWLKQRAKETGFDSSAAVEKGAAALIDAFLAKGEVKMGPIRDASESTEEWAQRGLVEDPSLVTETMAKLYAQQGQMSRARKAYKLLALKYPAKSVYFAAQLKRLRNS